jgi:parallel beta-helix repeat protein
VLNNKIRVNDIIKYGILVTGESTDGAPTPNFNFEIAGNDVLQAQDVGIWLNGREGTNYRFRVIGNLVNEVRDFFGIGVADCRDGCVSDNVVLSTGYQGIYLYQETSGGGALSVIDVVVSGNIVKNANVLLRTSAAEGSAITLNDSSSGCVVTSNRVVGSNHRWGVYFGPSTTGCIETANNVEAGTLGKVSSASNTNRVAYGTYTPSLTAVANVASSVPYLCNYTVVGDIVLVRFKLVVTPTAAGSTATQLGISLPIASNLASNDTDLHGNASSSFGLTASIYADPTNDRAQLQFAATNTSNNVLYGQFAYRIL